MKCIPYFLVFTIFIGCRTTDPTGESNLESVDDIVSSLGSSTADGELSPTEAVALFEEAGNRISPNEGLAIYNAIRNPQGYKVSPEAVKAAEDFALNIGLSATEQGLLQSGKSHAGTEVPAAVKKVLLEARLAGAVAYDVREPDPDDPNEGMWSPYPQDMPAIDALTFTHTEITPASLQADMDSTLAEDRISGTDGNGSVTYTKDSCIGRRGSIISHFDENFHPNVKARGRSCQKWANNCAILADGTMHCLPASRRATTTGEFASLILTNPSLARGQALLFNGHIRAQNGVIVAVGMSGRIAKRAARNKYSFIDPVPLLAAWGFKLAPGLRTRSEHGGTSSEFVNHGLTGTVRGPLPANP